MFEMFKFKSWYYSEEEKGKGRKKNWRLLKEDGTEATEGKMDDESVEILRKEEKKTEWALYWLCGFLKIVLVNMLIDNVKITYSPKIK